MSRDDARAAAHRAFGGVEQVKEIYRDRRGLPFFGTLAQDLRYATRTLSPGFTITVVLTLAIGIGATTAIFSVVDAVIFRPLSYPDADRLVVVEEWTPRFGAIPVNGMHFEKWRKDAQSFAHMALVGGVGDGSSVNLTGAGEPERIPAARVSSSLFQMLGARAELGRMLINDDEQLGRDQVVVISHNLWRRRFASDPDIVGRSITLDGSSHEVVGVLSAAFHFPKLGHLYAIDIAAERPDIWKPMALRPQELTKGNFDFVAVLSASMAARAWPGQDAVGRRFRFGRGTGPLIEVVGIVADVRGISLDRGPSTTVYMPYWQEPSQRASIAVKTATDPVAMSSSIRAVIHDLDAELLLSAFRTMDDVVANSVSRRRFQMNLVPLFAATGTLLASIGIYGVMSYVVAQRTNEIGTRLALGANPQAVQRMVLADALRLVSGGLVVGVPLALATAATFRSLLFGVAPYDRLSVIGACMVLTTAAITAAYIPARRASRVDPMVALRCE